MERRKARTHGRAGEGWGKVMSAVCAGPGRGAESLGMTRPEGSGVGVRGEEGWNEEACGRTAGEEAGLAVGPARLPGGATWPLADHQGSGLREPQPLAGSGRAVGMAAGP